MRLNIKQKEGLSAAFRDVAQVSLGSAVAPFLIDSSTIHTVPFGLGLIVSFSCWIASLWVVGKHG